jgi:hypothetical protein
MRVVTAVKPMGGKGASRATRYIAESKLDPEREGRQRPLFTDRDDSLTYTKANRSLTGGQGAPLKMDLIHFSTCFREEDFEKLGANDEERKERLREAAREAISDIKADLGVSEWRWVAGIHLNTDHPHIHTLIHKKVTDHKTQHLRRLGNLPKRMLPHSRRGPDGEIVRSLGMMGERFIAALERAQERARESQREREEATMAIRLDDEITKTSGKDAPSWPLSWIDQMREFAARNPSLAGRELTMDLIERGPQREPAERPAPTEDIREALKNSGIDDSDYRTREEQADWLARHSQDLRDLYEHGADIKGDTLIIPAEEHEISDERDGIRVIGIAHAYAKIQDPNLAAEFHSLARSIAGETADPGTEIKVFQHYYEQIEKDEAGRPLKPYEKEYQQKKADSLDRALGEMRLLAGEMAKLETKESIEIASSLPTLVSLEELDNDRGKLINPEEESVSVREDPFYEAEEYRDDSTSNEYEFSSVEAYSERAAEGEAWKYSTAAHKINLNVERLRFPEGLSYETREWLIRAKLPELDRKVEDGHSLSDIKDDAGRVVAKGLLSQIDSLAHPEREEILRRLSELIHSPGEKLQFRIATADEQSEARRTLLELSLDAKRRLESKSNLLGGPERDLLARAETLAQGLQASLAKDAPNQSFGHPEDTELYVSLGGGRSAVRLPVRNIQIYDAIQKMADAARLPFATWHGKEGVPLINGFPEREYDARVKIAGFLKNYLSERLNDPETRLLHSNENFRAAHRAIEQAHTPEELNQISYEFTRNQQEDRTLGERARKILFHGRTPAHYTPEMIELRQTWGLPREEREQALRDGKLPPSPALTEILTELDSRQSVQAIRQFQASLLNPPERMNNPGKSPLYQMHKQLLGHEQDYVFHLSHDKIQNLAGRSQPVQEHSEKRAFGAAPRDGSYKEYIASVVEIRQGLLDQTISRLEERHGQSLSSDARARIAQENQLKFLARAGDLALERLIPPEALGPHLGETALHIRDAIAHVKHDLQPQMLLAIRISNELANEKGEDRNPGLRSNDSSPGDSRHPKEKLSQEQSIDLYVKARREDLYRGFESIDEVRVELKKEHLADREALGAVLVAETRYEAASHDYQLAKDRGGTFRFLVHDASVNQDRRISAFDVERRAAVRAARAADQLGLERTGDRHELQRQIAHEDLSDHSITLQEHSKVQRSLTSRLDDQQGRAQSELLQAQQLARNVADKYEARGQALPAPFIDRKVIYELQEAAIQRGFPDRFVQLEQIRGDLAAELNQPNRLDEAAARLRAQFFVARTDLATKEDREARFGLTRHLREWDIKGEKVSLADLDRRLEHENDRASLFGKYTLHLDPYDRSEAKNEIERLNQLREIVTGKIAEEQQELRNQVQLSEKTVNVLSQAYEGEAQSRAQSGQEMPEPKFHWNEIERVTDNAATMRDATLLKHVQFIEARFNTYANPEERISPDQLLARAAGREVMAHIFQRESVDRLAVFRERGDRQSLGIETAGGDLTARTFRDTKPQSIAAMVLRPVIESGSDRELRGAAQTALSQYRAHLTADVEKGASYLETARGLTLRLHEEINEHRGSETRLPRPELTPKQQMQLEIYAERLSDPRERGYFLDLARSDSQHSASSRNPQTHAQTTDHGREAPTHAPEPMLDAARGR